MNQDIASLHKPFGLGFLPLVTEDQLEDHGNRPVSVPQVFIIGIQ